MAQGLFGFSPIGLVVGVLQQARTDASRGADTSRTGNCPPGQYLAGRPPRCVGTVQAPYDPGPVALPEPVFMPSPPVEPAEPTPAFAPPAPVAPIEPLPLPAPLPQVPAEPLPLTPDPVPPPAPTAQPRPPASPEPSSPEPWRGRPDFGKFDHLGRPTQQVGTFVKALRVLSGPVGWFITGVLHTGGVGKPGRGEKYPRGEVLFPQVVTVPKVKVPNAPATVRRPARKDLPRRDPGALPTLPEIVVTGQRPVALPSTDRIARPVARPALPTVGARPVITRRAPARAPKPAVRPAARPGVLKFKLDPLALFKLLPHRSPRRVVQPLPTSPRTTVYPVEQPYAPPVETPPLQPVGQPKPSPATDFPPKPAERPTARPGLTPFNPTLLPYIPTQLDPLPLAQPLPQRTSRCDCTQTKTKDRKRKPRQPRAVCYVGTYRESAFGLSKTKREQVPCR